MKKIIVCMAVAVVAFCANAASFQWSAAKVYCGDALASGVNGYFVFADQLAADAAAAALKDGKVSSIKDVASSTYAIANGAVTASKTTFERKDATAGTAYDGYYVILSEDESTYYMSDVKSMAAKDVGAVTFAWGNQESATKGVAWTKVGGVEPGPGGVPEPTSGLLLVLGGAALALRRKQK